MKVNSPINNNINYNENRSSDAVYTGIAGALMGGSAGALYGVSKKPDFDQFSKTAYKLLENAAKNEQKQLRKIAKRLSNDPKYELSKEQTALLEKFQLTGKSPKDISLAASKIGREHNLEAITERVQKTIDKIKLHIQNINEIKIAKDKNTPAVKERVNNYIKENAAEFFQEGTFKNKKDAVSFFNKKLKSLKEFQNKVDVLAKNQIQNAIDFANGLSDIFSAKQNEIKDSIITAYKNHKSTKYMILGGLVAGIAAGLTAFTQKEKVKEVYVPVKEELPHKTGKSVPEQAAEEISKEVDTEKEIDD